MDALALLRLQLEWGADEALEEAPIDRLRRPAPLSVAKLPPVPAVAPSPSMPVGSAPSLEGLRAAIAAFEGCALRNTASHLVFASGDPESGLLIIGDPPSASEDRSGRPFDGPAGAYLDRMLASIGLNREGALLAPLIPWRPPGGRPPSAAEVSACLPFLHRLIVLTAPRRIVLLGTLAQRSLLGSAPRRRAPAWLLATVPGRPEPLPALPLPSPDLLLANTAGRREAWSGLRLLKRALNNETVTIPPRDTR